jgi:hypothetical protein
LSASGIFTAFCDFTTLFRFSLGFPAGRGPQSYPIGAVTPIRDRAKIPPRFRPMGSPASKRLSAG